MSEISVREASDFLRALNAIEVRLDAALGIFPKLPNDATAAAGARAAARVRGFYFAPDFAKAIGRHKQWVTDRCSAGVIKTLPGGKPFRIPLSEEVKWNSVETE